MIIDDVEITTDDPREFWLTWIYIVQGTLDLKPLTKKELQIVLNAILSPYSHPFRDMGAYQLSKKAGIPRSKYINYKASIKEKGWLDNNEDFIPHIQNLRSRFNNDTVKESLCFVFRLGINRQVRDE